eukprot:ctg_1869.g400
MAPVPPAGGASAPEKMMPDESGSNGHRSPDKTASAAVNGTADTADGHLSPEDAEMKERLDGCDTVGDVVDDLGAETAQVSAAALRGAAAARRGAGRALVPLGRAVGDGHDYVRDRLAGVSAVQAARDGDVRGLPLGTRVRAHAGGRDR